MTREREREGGEREKERERRGESNLEDLVHIVAEVVGGKGWVERLEVDVIDVLEYQTVRMREVDGSDVLE